MVVKLHHQNFSSIPETFPGKGLVRYLEVRVLLLTLWDGQAMTASRLLVCKTLGDLNPVRDHAATQAGGGFWAGQDIDGFLSEML